MHERLGERTFIGQEYVFICADFFSRFNSALASNRRQNLSGVYDPHTNIMQYPKIMQPTHARWEQVSATPANPKTSMNTANGLDEGNHEEEGEDVREQGSIFPEVPSIFERNFMISDTCYVCPTSSTLGYPGPDEETLDIAPPGLAHVPEEVLAELPDECRSAFDAARAEEIKWKDSWGGETNDRARAELRISYNT